MPFRSETLYEARDRLLAQIEEEKKGFAEATRGVLSARRGIATDPDSIQGLHLQMSEDQRLMRSTSSVHESEIGEDGADVEVLRRGRTVDDVADEVDEIQEGISPEFQQEQARNAETGGESNGDNQGQAEGQGRQNRGGAQRSRSGGSRKASRE